MSSNLDCYIVNELIQNGLAQGDDISSNSSPTEYEFQDLRITITGREYLSQPSAKKATSWWRTENYGFQYCWC